MNMKKYIFSILLLCLCTYSLFAQRSALDDFIYPENSNKATYSPTLWEGTTLYYYISNSSHDLTFSQCETAIQSAFNTWAQNSRFTFIQTNNLSQADIKLSWEVGNHGSLCSGFFNTSIVAHATPGKLTSLSPPGQVHFNDLCSFSIDETHYDVESVALHEIGHVLGLPDNYDNPLNVMYYNLLSGTTRRVLTTYDITALYNTYSHPYSINGPKLICTNSAFSLDVIPSGATFSWSLIDNYYNTGYNLLIPNYPTPGHCVIVRDQNHDLMDDTLKVEIKYNNITVQTLRMGPVYAYAGFKGNYTSGNLSGVIPNSHYFNIRTNVTTYIKSPNFYGATVSYSNSGATPSIWGFSSSNGDLTFETTTPNAAVVINVTDICGNSYVLYAYATNQYRINVSNENGGIIVTLNDDDDSQRSSSIDQLWTIEVRNVTTGQLMAIRSSTNRSETISTAGWPKGIYVVKATIGKEVFTEKVIVK